MAVPIDESRVERTLSVIVAAAQGDYDVRVALEEHDDRFLEIEVGVNLLLEELTERRAQNEAQREELRARAEQVAAQQDELVQALSTPIIVVWPGVLALPIIGRVEDARAAMITTTVLQRVAAERASHVILDLTGVSAFAPGTMTAILRMTRAIGLLGATCMLTGIRPDVARQIVALGVDDARVQTTAQLSDALARVLADRGALRR